MPRRSADVNAEYGTDTPGVTAPYSAEDTPRRKKGGKSKAMTNEQISQLIRRRMASAINYRDRELTPLREKIRRYSEGDKNLDGDLEAQDGRSAFVSRDVRDVTMALAPDLVEVFLGDDENIVEFHPVGPEDVEGAQEATEFVNYKLRQVGGLQLFWSVIMDALKAHVGPVWYGWQEKKRVISESYQGLSQEERDAVLFETPTRKVKVTQEVVEQREQPAPQGPMPGGPPQMGPMGPMPPAPPQMIQVPFYDLDVEITETKGDICINTIPPEERLIDENASSLHEASFWAWAKTTMTVGDLVALGYDENECIEAAEHGDEWDTDLEAESRENAGNRTEKVLEGTEDPSMLTVPFAKCFVRGDLTGEGVSSLYYVCVIGAQCTIPKGHKPKPVDEASVAEFLSIPVEHVATGMPYAALAIDLQQLRTGYFRAMNDSLAHAIFPQRGYHETQVNAHDLLNGEPGALVRCKSAPGQLVTEFQHTFAGAQVLAILQYTDEVKENRTGISRTNAGLDPNALQSTAKRGVDTIVSGSQKQIKLTARVLAEFGFKPLAKGMLKLLVQHSKAPEYIRLRNREFKFFNPRDWNPDMDCRVAVGLGGGSREEKIQGYTLLGTYQEKLAMAKSPLVDDTKVFNLVSAIAKSIGHPNPTLFFNPPQPTPPGGAPQQQQQAPDPNEALARAEMFKAETERKSAQEKNLNERVKIILEDQRERAKMMMDARLASAKLMVESKQALDLAHLDAANQRTIETQWNENELRAKALELGAQQAQAQAEPQPESPV